MQDPRWMGTSPSNPFWSPDSRTLYFNWNPDNAASDSVYFITINNRVPQKSPAQWGVINANNISWNNKGTAFVFTRQGDIYLYDQLLKKQTRITNTVEAESGPVFIENDNKVAFIRNQDYYAWDINAGTTYQLSNFEKGSAQRKQSASEQETFLQTEQLHTSMVLSERKKMRELREEARKQQSPPRMKTIYTGDRNLSGLSIDPHATYISYRLVKPATGTRSTYVPDYVTESGFTSNLTARPKVGAAPGGSEFYIYDRERDTVIHVKTNDIPGIKDQPDFVKDYPADTAAKNKIRPVTFYGPFWSPSGKHAIVDIRSSDNKDRWIMLLDPVTGKLKNLHRQRDEAWVGGPGIFSLFSGNSWIDENTFWFQGEETGYSHLYTYNISTGRKTAVTSGNFEVLNARLSKDKKTFYITTNEVHPGEQHLYNVAVTGGTRTRLTQSTGAHQAFVSPDEKHIAIIHSYSNKPWELFLQENKKGGKLFQITNKAQSAEFAAYAWKDPELINFKASDGANVYARLYKPAQPHPSKPAVVFVHGAGYLQNAHKWWSSYFREYMFHNLLTDLGYTVLDIDYRGSAGYGRDWRTGIYRHMGGKDLDDHIDGAKYLADVHGIDPKRIGIYGGSYGGFITLMALFTKPDAFAAGAALRSVTDWAHYNHPYTSNILNEPYNDSLAYRRSSPIYYAEGLQSPLLMCHGMVDVNVHFQDIVRLTQRLIELRKENWELAVYPVEDHAFVEPSSWADEYKRILKLFETHLKK